MQTRERYKEYDTDRAKKLAELRAIEIDLEKSVTWLRMLVKSMQKEPKPSANRPERESLWNAALMSYRRCFNSGARKERLTPDIYVIEGAKEYHDWLINMANKKVAHSVNEYEQTKTSIIVKDDGQTVTPVGIRVRHQDYSYPGSAEDVMETHDLMVIAWRHATNEAQKTEDLVTQESKLVSAEELLKVRDQKFIVPRTKFAGKRRNV